MQPYGIFAFASLSSVERTILIFNGMKSCLQQTLCFHFQQIFPVAHRSVLILLALTQKFQKFNKNIKSFKNIYQVTHSYEQTHYFNYSVKTVAQLFVT